MRGPPAGTVGLYCSDRAQAIADAAFSHQAQSIQLGISGYPKKKFTSAQYVTPRGDNEVTYSGLKSWLTLSSTSPDVAVAQLREVRRQIPLMYILLTMNAVAVAYTHFQYAPVLLTIAIPVALTALCAVRVVGWLFGTKNVAITAEYATSLLRGTAVYGGLLAAAYICWSLAMDRYGGPFERGHIAVFISVTVIGCIFCLMHLPQAALLITAVVMVPYLIHYISEGNTVFTAIAFNVALVTVVMTRVLFNSFTAFTDLVQSQDKLAAKQQETEQLSVENARVAHTDSLTGLPNRRFFFAKLDEMLRARGTTGERFVVGILDLDRFKPLNDTYGHAIGDRLLAQVGIRLQQEAAENVIIARLGGDEFGLLILDEVDRAVQVSQAFCDILTHPFTFDDFQVSVGACCGLAIYPEAGTSAHELFDRADYALYHVKAECRGSSGLFSLAHETAIRSERALEAALREADLDAEIDVHFQPIVNIDSMKVAAVEALARCTSPKLGRVSPDDFIPIAERTGLIHSVTCNLFQKAVMHTLSLPGHIGLSFNLSANDITSPATVSFLVEILQEGAIAPGRITFELTETALLRDFAAAEAALGRLRVLGAQIALDDFGTGYSSLSYLQRLSPDKIKVDKSFTADLDSFSGRNIAAAISGLCDNLNLECIFEGIESEEQLTKIHRLGNHFAQGYLFARPMSLSPLLQWLQEPRLEELRLPARKFEQTSNTSGVAA